MSPQYRVSGIGGTYHIQRGFPCLEAGDNQQMVCPMPTRDFWWSCRTWEKTIPRRIGIVHGLDTLAQFQNVIRHIPFDGRNSGAAYFSVEEATVSCFNFEVRFFTHVRYAAQYRADGKIVTEPIHRQCLAMRSFVRSNDLKGYGQHI